MPAYGYSPEELRAWDRTGIDPHACGPVPTTQPDLFLPMCGRNVATQRDLFATDDPKDRPRRCPCGHMTTAEVCTACGKVVPTIGRLPDLPGQRTFA
jgi:hypothetical protein